MKYRITSETRDIGAGRSVRRIVSESGVVGGFVEAEENLSQTGSCWLHGDSIACEESRVADDAQIYGLVEGRAHVGGSAEIFGHVHGSVTIRGMVKVYGTVGGTQTYEGEEVLFGSHP